VRLRAHRSGLSLLVRAAAAGLLAASAMVATASAGNTRVIYYGAPSGDANGVAPATAASAGNATGVGLLVRNDGKQTVNHVTVGIGSLAATSGNPPVGPSLPAGWTVAAVFGAGSCTITADFLGASCLIGGMASRSSAALTVVLNVAGAGPASFWASVKLDENTNDNGSNTDTFFAQGSLTVDPSDGDHYGNFLLPNVGGTVGTGFANLGATDQGTTVTVPGNPNGTPISITEAAGGTCASGVSCFGAISTGHVLNGATITPYLTWTIRWDASVLPRGFNPTKAGVVHILDNGKLVTIFNTKKNVCTATRTLDCVVSATLTSTYFQIVVQTATNGGMRGFG
jgi:hypothetical protein